MTDISDNDIKHMYFDYQEQYYWGVIKKVMSKAKKLHRQKQYTDIIQLLDGFIKLGENYRSSRIIGAIKLMKQLRDDTQSYLE